MARLRSLARRYKQRARTPIQGFYINGWQDGWLPNIEKTIAPPTSVYDLSNVVWNEDYTLSKRSGYTNIATTVGDMGEAEFIFAPRVLTMSGLFPQYTQQVLYFNDSDGELFYNSLGELWAKSEDAAEGSNFNAPGIGMGGSSDSAVNRFRVYPVAVATFEDKIYMTTLKTGGFDASTNLLDETATGLWATVDESKAGHTVPIIYDVTNTTFDQGSSGTRAAHLNDLDGVSGGLPGARCLIAKYARLFAGNVYKGGVYRYPSRIYWCGDDAAASIDPELWDADNYIEVGADDGQEIVAMVSFSDQILIFKNQSIWTLVGTDDTTFALYQLDDHLGTEGTYAVASTNNVAYFLDERTGIWQYDGAEFKDIGRPINDKLLAELNREAAYKVNLILHNHLLYVSIPTGTQSTADVSVTYVFDTRIGTWTRWNYGIIPSPFPMYSDLPITGPTVALVNDMFGGIPGTGLFRFNNGTTDNGTAITADVTTPWFNPGEVGDRHRLRRLEVIGDEGDGAITVHIYTDLEADSTKTTVTYNPATGTENVLYTDMTVDDFLWTYLSMKFAVAGGNAMNLFGVGMTISTRPSPRGIFTKTGYTA